MYIYIYALYSTYIHIHPDMCVHMCRNMYKACAVDISRHTCMVDHIDLYVHIDPCLYLQQPWRSGVLWATKGAM